MVFVRERLLLDGHAGVVDMGEGHRLAPSDITVGLVAFVLCGLFHTPTPSSFDGREIGGIIEETSLLGRVVGIDWAADPPHVSFQPFPTTSAPTPDIYVWPMGPHSQEPNGAPVMINETPAIRSVTYYVPHAHQLSDIAHIL